MRGLEYLLELFEDEISPANIYYLIRDIPFSYEQLSMNERIDKVLRRQFGSCTAKHYVLGKIYEDVFGMDVRYVTVEFYWKDFDLILPKYLIEMKNKLPVTHHCCLYLNDRFVDATWDKYIGVVGFPILEFDSNKISVPAKEVIFHYNIDEREKFLDEKRTIYTKREKVLIRNFYIELSKWLWHVRTKNLQYSNGPARS